MGLKRGIMLELDDGVYTISFPYVPLGGLWGGQEVKNSVRKAEIFFKVIQEKEASAWAVLIIIGGIEKKMIRSSRQNCKDLNVKYTINNCYSICYSIYN